MNSPSIAWSDVLNIDGRDVSFVFIENGKGIITECDFGRTKRKSDKGASSKALFVGTAPVLNITVQEHGRPSCERLLASGMGRSRADRSFVDAIERAGNSGYDSLIDAVDALKPILTMLQTGAYLVYYTKLYPSDGAGNFFWSLNGMPQELKGSAARSSSLGRDSTMLPCFLLPTQHPAVYNSSRVSYYREIIKSGGTVGGVALHVSGLFCALLDGHHRATAALLEGVDFYSMVIERIDGFYFEDPDLSEDNILRPQGLMSTSSKIPFSMLPLDVMRRVLLLRRGAKPLNYYDLLVHYNAQDQGYRGGIWSDEIVSKSELLPDVDMMLSAQAIKSLSDEELAMLLDGHTLRGGKPIVNQNLYSSIVTASNFLQFTDPERFVTFALSVLQAPDLAATHTYLAERLRNSQDMRVYDYYAFLLEEQPKDMERIFPAAEAFVKEWEQQQSQAQAETQEVETQPTNTDNN